MEANMNQKNPTGPDAPFGGSVPETNPRGPATIKRAKAPIQVDFDLKARAIPMSTNTQIMGPPSRPKDL
jgi:hypothetical protein